MSHIMSGHKTETLSLTASSTTSEALDFREYSHGTIANESGGALTITYYAQMGPGGTALALEDEDNVAVTQTLGDDEVCALPSACAGASFLVLVLSTGTAEVTVHCKR